MGSGLLPGGFLTLNAISAHSGYLTKPHRPTDIDFSQFGRPDGPDQGPHSWLPVRPTPGLADSRPPSRHVLQWPFLHVHSWAEGAHSLRPLLTGALMRGVGPTCMTSSSPDHLPEVPPGTGTLGVRASTEEFWGDTVQSTANPKPLPSVPCDSPTGITPPQDLCVPHLGTEGARAGFSGGSQWVCTVGGPALPLRPWGSPGPSLASRWPVTCSVSHSPRDCWLHPFLLWVSSDT